MRGTVGNRFKNDEPHQAGWDDMLLGVMNAADVAPRQLEAQNSHAGLRLEQNFDPVFTTRLALREKQIQQNYRPVIGIHKCLARRPGTLFRSLLLAVYEGAEPVETGYWREHRLPGVIADPFIGGGTPIYEARWRSWSTRRPLISSPTSWFCRGGSTSSSTKRSRMPMRFSGGELTPSPISQKAMC